MSWRRLGVVFVPDGKRLWARSHAAMPTPVHLDANVFRFFYSSRDADNRSHVGWVDVEISESPRILETAREPVLSPGEDGTFDDSGISVGCVARSEGGLKLYYMGWNLGIRSPWRNAIGVACAKAPDGPFERFSAGPILDRSPEDPYTLTYPWVVQFGPGDWRMWYGSNLGASLGNEELRHVIKVARSNDGLHWHRDGATVISLEPAKENIVSRPSVVQVGRNYLMNFATRGPSYRVGGAWSTDGVRWARIDPIIGLDRSQEGWDADMTCYPALFWHGGRLWLAYNGNGYGATGFGLAVWEGADPLATVSGGAAQGIGS
jgi:hypothetical protein